MGLKTCLILFHIFCGAAFANDEIHYQDILDNFIERAYYANEFTNAEQKKPLLDLSQTVGCKDESKLNAVSAWKLLQMGAESAQDKNDTSLEKCVNNTMDTIAALTAGETWAVSLIDATGKLGSGLLKGNSMWMGSFSECMETRASRTLPDNSTQHLFDGQYCVATFQSPKGSSNPTKNIVIKIGLCVPNTCSRENVNDFINSAISMLNNGSIAIDAKITQYTPKSIPLTVSAISVIVLLSLLGFVILFGTLYDVCLHQPALQKVKSSMVVIANENSASSTDEPNRVLSASEHTPLLRERRDVIGSGREKSVPMRILLAFSIYTNGNKILTTQRTPGSLDCVHGIRFISMTWVILGHTCLFSIIFGQNPLDGLNWFSRWTFQAIGNATFSVDTFFVLSGALVSYLLLKELKSKDGPRHISWPMFFFHRFWRLTPMYMLLLVTYTTLFVYWGNGPLWPYESGPEPNCKKYWWSNLLYVNNFVKQQNECMAWSWYLANDMQFFILSPLIIVAFYYRSCIGLIVSMVLILTSLLYTALYSALHHFALPISIYQLKEGLDGLNWFAGLLFSFVFLVACFVSTSIIVIRHGYGMGLIDMIKPGQQDYFDALYQKPWCRIGPYVVGTMTGYLLHITEKQPPKIHKVLVASGWAIAAAINLAVLYGTIEYSRGAIVANWLSAFYNACSRTAWGIGVAWVIFACSRGYGGFVNTILSWPALIPLSRLTFAAYLVHPMVLMYFFDSQEERMLLTDITLIWFFLGSLVMSYMIAFVTSLAFEAPMMALEKIVFRRN